MSLHRKKDIVELTLHTRADYAGMAKAPVRLVLDSVRSMQNVGSMFRSADAFAIDGLTLCGITGRPPHAEIHKTALGAEESVEWDEDEDVMAAIGRLRRDGWTICSLEQAHGSVALPEFRPREGERYALVVGNEVTGVAQSVVDASDYVLEIPQYGTKHSLNVAVSAGIALWHFRTHLK